MCILDTDLEWAREEWEYGRWYHVIQHEEEEKEDGHDEDKDHHLKITLKITCK